MIYLLVLLILFFHTREIILKFLFILFQLAGSEISGEASPTSGQSGFTSVIPYSTTRSK